MVGENEKEDGEGARRRRGRKRAMGEAHSVPAKDLTHRQGDLSLFSFSFTRIKYIF
jgi:hypothetical protein